MSTAQQIADSISEEMRALPQNAQLEYLLEFSTALPPLPPQYLNHPELLEKVEECQSPVYLFVEVEATGTARIFLTAPDEAPTTKAFAAILQEILDRQPIQEILDFSDQFVAQLGITKLVSPLRIRGLLGMLNRIKRQVAEKSNA